MEHSSVHHIEVVVTQRSPLVNVVPLGQWFVGFPWRTRSPSANYVLNTVRLIVARWMCCRHGAWQEVAQATLPAATCLGWWSVVLESVPLVRLSIFFLNKWRSRCSLTSNRWLISCNGICLIVEPTRGNALHFTSSHRHFSFYLLSISQRISSRLLMLFVSDRRLETISPNNKRPLRGFNVPASQKLASDRQISSLNLTIVNNKPIHYNPVETTINYQHDFRQFPISNCLLFHTAIADNDDNNVIMVINCHGTSTINRSSERSSRIQFPELKETI